jgi:hypothetical protein
MSAIYLNIALVSGQDAINSKVAEKAGTGLFGKAMSYTATKLVTDETIVAKLATTLMQKVPEAIAEMGIRAEVTKKFQLKSFVVLQVVVKDVNKVALLKATKGEEYAAKFENLLSAMKALELEDALHTVDDKISEKIHESMMIKFAETIPLKVKASGLDIACKVCDSSQQSDYFFNTVDKLQA